MRCTKWTEGDKIHYCWINDEVGDTVCEERQTSKWKHRINEKKKNVTKITTQHTSMRNVIKNAPHSGNTPKRMAAERKIGMLFTVAINEIKPNEMEIMERNITQIINENNNTTLDTAVYILYNFINTITRIMQTSTRFWLKWWNFTFVRCICLFFLFGFLYLGGMYIFSLFLFFFDVSWMQYCLYTTPPIEKLEKQLSQHIFFNLVPATDYA